MELESVLDEKKNPDHTNELTIIEHGLNQETERLVKETISQKYRTAKLQSHLASTVTALDKVPGKTQKVHPEKRPKSKSPIKATNDKRCDSMCKRIFSPENGVTINSEHTML
jgi:hypothetical protein